MFRVRVVSVFSVVSLWALSALWACGGQVSDGLDDEAADLSGVKSAFRAPVGPLADPGVIKTTKPGGGERFVSFATGGLGRVYSSDVAAGPWKFEGRVLKRQAAWAAQRNTSLWAPSVIRVGNQYVAFYAALRQNKNGRDYEGQNVRCIGTATSPNAEGPYEPRALPLVCPLEDNGAPDHVAGRPIDQWTVGVIDATPRYLTFNGHTGLYLTYKTQSIPSSIRMVELDIASGATKIVGASHELTRNQNACEENPVLVQRGDTFTLFTSVGDYKTCNYHSYWRSSKHPWVWPANGTRLEFPANANTCATGDADVIPGLPDGSWRIFYSGHYPRESDGFHMYAGVLTWSGGVPRVTAMLDAPAP